MANPVSVPVFSGKSSLALSDLDAMADCVRDAQLKIGTLGGHTHRGHAQPGHAWYLPAAAAQEYGATSPRIAPGLVGGLKISREFTAPLIANGTIHLPMAHMETRHEIDPEDDTVAYLPGAIDAIEVREDSPAGLDYGTIVLPLAQSPTMEHDAASGVDYETAPGWAGLLRSAEFAAGIDSPELSGGTLRIPLAECGECVCTVSSIPGCTVSSIPGALAGVQVDSSVTAPYIAAGVLYLPPGGGESGGATFSESWPVSEKAGGLKWGCIAAVDALSSWDGKLYFPLAQATAAVPGCTVSSVPGAIAGVQADSSLTVPYIANGVLHLPAGGEQAPLARFGAEIPSPVAGMVKGGVFTSVVAMAAYEGVLYFPLAQAAAAATGCTVSSVPGAIAGVQTNEQATAPFIADGVLNMPPADGRLKGLRYLLGGRATWDEVSQSSGSEITVAGCWVTIDNKHTYVALHVGIDKDGYLTFTLSNG